MHFFTHMQPNRSNALTHLMNFLLFPGENKITIKRELKLAGDPLVRLETRLNSNDLIEAQVGFCAQWCLDNLC